MTTRQLLEQAMDTLGNVAGNINPERGYSDELEADVKAMFQAIRAELAKPEQQERKPMTEDQIIAFAQIIFLDARWPSSAIELARAVERHHGIKDTP